MSRHHIVITSISAPNSIMNDIAKKAHAHGDKFIVIGDNKSPKDFFIKHTDFYSLEAQLDSDFKFAQMAPTGHYARKNAGYLYALSDGAEIILETDDDNLPLPAFYEARESTPTAGIVAEAGWVNVYRYFSDSLIWPRGLPLDLIHEPPPAPDESTTIFCPVQQGLADENPDVDAIYRLILPLPQNFMQREPVAMTKGSWCPFNSQNTTWFKPAFELMYLPSYCTFRMTDIWRSMITQRIAWENEWGILFHNATVVQDRNEHNLMQDFKDEVPGYLNNTRIGESLMSLDIQPGIENIGSNMLTCYEQLVTDGHVGKEEIPLLQAWQTDLHSIQDV